MQLFSECPPQRINVFLFKICTSITFWNTTFCSTTVLNFYSAEIFPTYACVLWTELTSLCKTEERRWSRAEGLNSAAEEDSVFVKWFLDACHGECVKGWTKTAYKKCLQKQRAVCIGCVLLGCWTPCSPAAQTQAMWRGPWNARPCALLP